MTVLQKNEGRGLSKGNVKSYLVGLALAVVGVGAAFGLSRVLETDTGPNAASTFKETDIPSRSTQPAAEWTLEEELAAIRGGNTFAAAGATAVLSNIDAYKIDAYKASGEVYGEPLDKAAAERATVTQQAEAHTRQR